MAEDLSTNDIDMYQLEKDENKEKDFTRQR